VQACRTCRAAAAASPRVAAGGRAAEQGAVWGFGWGNGVGDRGREGAREQVGRAAWGVGGRCDYISLGLQTSKPSPEAGSGLSANLFGPIAV